MVDMEDAASAGIDGILKQLAFGRGRYGERIYDQVSNLTQKEIMHSDLPELDKIGLLGHHIYSELLTHADFGGESNLVIENFADGGPVNSKKKIVPRYSESGGTLTLSQVKKFAKPGQDYFRDYLLSPKYKERLIKQGYDPLEYTSRLVNALSVGFELAPNEGSSYYNRRRNVIGFDEFNPKETEEYYSTFENTLVHELSHAAGATSDRMNDRDKAYINARNKYNFSKYKNDPDLEHDREPTEVRADMDVLRFELKKAGLYDPGTENFNQNHLDQAKKKFGKMLGPQRLFKRFGDKSLIDIMNTVASNAQPQQRFASGGETKKVKGRSGATYNVNTSTGLDQFGNKWESAPGGWRVAQKAPTRASIPGRNSRKKSTAAKSTKNPTPAQARAELEKWMPEIAPAKPIVGYNRNGQAVYSDQVRTPTIYDDNSGRLLVANKDYFPQVKDTTTNRTVLPEGDTDRAARAKIFRNQNIVNNSISAITGLTGALIASNNRVPKYELPEEYTRMREEVIGSRNEGFTAEESAAIDQDINQGYANGVAAIRGIAGGGATQGSVLSALGSLNANVDRSYLDKATRDAQLRRQNRANYQNVVYRDLQLDKEQYSAEAQNAAMNQQQGIQMLAQSVQDLYDQEQYNQSYGPDTLFNELQESALAKEKSYQELLKLQSQLALNQINSFNQPAALPEVDPVELATSSTYRNPLRNLPKIR